MSAICPRTTGDASDDQVVLSRIDSPEIGEIFMSDTRQNYLRDKVQLRQRYPKDGVISASSLSRKASKTFEKYFCDR